MKKISTKVIIFFLRNELKMSITAATNNPATNSSPFSMKQLQHVVEDEVLSVFPEFGRQALTSPAARMGRVRSGCPSAAVRIDPNSVPKVLRRNSSYENIFLGRNERRVCVIYTGGTIGMVRSPRGGNYSYFLYFLQVLYNFECEF